jgi:hypothetical protein
LRLLRRKSSIGSAGRQVARAHWYYLLCAITRIGKRLLTSSHPGSFNPIRRNPEPFQQIRSKVRVTNTSATRAVSPNQTVLVRSDELHVAERLALQVGKGLEAMGKGDVFLRQGALENHGQQAANQGHFHQPNFAQERSIVNRICEGRSRPQLSDTEIGLRNACSGLPQPLTGRPF